MTIYGGTQAGIYSNQIISEKSKVKLVTSPGQNTPPTLYFATYPITQKIAQLVIEGSGVFSFGAHGVAGHRFLMMDDIIIDSNSQFTITWYFSDTHLLVKKNSKYLLRSLRGLRFDQYPTKTAGIKDYDDDYYEIGPGFPEPTTYGAIFGAVGMGMWIWQRRKYRRRTNECTAQ